MNLEPEGQGQLVSHCWNKWNSRKSVFYFFTSLKKQQIDARNVDPPESWEILR